MKFKNLNITSATALDTDLNFISPICFLCGRYSDLVLDLMRELIGDRGVKNDPDRIDDGRFVICADIESDEKNYSVCYIRNADFIGDNRIAVNFEPSSINFSLDDSAEFIQKCNELDVNGANCLIDHVCDFDAADKIDERPLFIYGYFDKLDKAIDITPIIDKLASLGRQVFVAVCANYPPEKIIHSDAEIAYVDVQ